MDNLTHSLVGAAVSKAGAERATPLATATLVLAANAPDVDMLSFVRGEYFVLAFRRGVTHGVPAMVVLPFLVTAVMLGWDRWVRRRGDPDAPPARAGQLLILAAVGVLTHPVLDWMNIYGMRWWLPFDPTWTYGDSLFIIDPWIWLALGGSVFLASSPGRRGQVGWGLLGVVTTVLLVAGVGGWPAVAWGAGLGVVLAVRLTRGPGEDGRRAGLVGAACLVAVGYMALMAVADERARSHVRTAAEAGGLQVVDVLVAPVRGLPHRSEVEVRTPDAYVPGSHDWTRTPRTLLRPEDAVPLLDAPPDVAPDTVERIVAAARRMPRVENYLVWSRFPYVRVRRTEGGWEVRVADARYDSVPEAGGLSGLRVFVAGP